jgi:pyruvate ferredoxin oxidoreductase beta subunit
MAHEHRLKFYQEHTFTVGDRLAAAHRTEQASLERANAITSGHRACPGCGEALGARYVLDAAMRVTGGKLLVVNATGCLAAALQAKGRTAVRVLAQGGDGGTTDIGFACLSGMFERNDDVLYVCYDNEAYMNTGVQRSSATPAAARTSTTPALGDAPGNPFGTGKNVPLIALAHGIPYVATASVADIHDLEAKVRAAMALRGARYLHVHVPCPLGWGSESADTIRIARLAVASGLFPLFEGADGEIVRATPLRKRVKVDEYLRLQKRFAHLFDGSEHAKEGLARIQAMADRNVARFRLEEEAP